MQLTWSTMDCVWRRGAAMMQLLKPGRTRRRRRSGEAFPLNAPPAPPPPPPPPPSPLLPAVTPVLHCASTSPLIVCPKAASAAGTSKAATVAGSSASAAFPPLGPTVCLSTKGEEDHSKCEQMAATIWKMAATIWKMAATIWKMAHCHTETTFINPALPPGGPRL